MNTDLCFTIFVGRFAGGYKRLQCMIMTWSKSCCVYPLCLGSEHMDPELIHERLKTLRSYRSSSRWMWVLEGAARS